MCHETDFKYKGKKINKFRAFKKRNNTRNLKKLSTGNTKEELSFLKIPGASKLALQSKVKVLEDLCIPYKDRHLLHRIFLNFEIYHRRDYEKYRKKYI